MGARQNNWDVSAAMQKDPLLSASEVDMVHNDPRNSYYPSDFNGAGHYNVNHNSTYADSTYDGYRPPTSGAGSLYNASRNQSSGGLVPVETRQPKRLSDYGGERHDASNSTTNERPVKRKSLGGGTVQVYEDYSGGDDTAYGYHQQQERSHGQRMRSRGGRGSSGAMGY